MKSIKPMIKSALTLTAVCVCIALCLAVVNAITKGPIAEAEQKAKDKAIHTIFPEFDSYKSIDISEISDIPQQISEVSIVTYKNATIGYVVEVVSDSGYGGSVTMMIGINSDGTLKSLEIINHSETAGLGANIEKQEFRDRFKGISNSAVLGENIDAISGATISSRAVVAGVNHAFETIKLILDTSDIQTEPTSDSTSELTTETENVERGTNSLPVIEETTEAATTEYSESTQSETTSEGDTTNE